MNRTSKSAWRRTCSVLACASAALAAIGLLASCQAQRITATPKALPWKVQSLTSVATYGGEPGSRGTVIYRMHARNTTQDTLYITGFADSLGGLLPAKEVWVLAPKAEATFEATRSARARNTATLEGDQSAPSDASATAGVEISTFVAITWRLGQEKATQTRLSPVIAQPVGPALPR